MHCANDWAARNYAHTFGIEEAKQDAINARIGELLKGKWNPEHPRNIEEALDNLNKDQREIRTAIVLYKSFYGIEIMRNWVRQWCELMAEQQANEEIQ